MKIFRGLRVIESGLYVRNFVLVFESRPFKGIDDTFTKQIQRLDFTEVVIGRLP